MAMAHNGLLRGTAMMQQIQATCPDCGAMFDTEYEEGAESVDMECPSCCCEFSVEFE